MAHFRYSVTFCNPSISGDSHVVEFSHLVDATRYYDSVVQSARRAGALLTVVLSEKVPNDSRVWKIEHTTTF